MSYPGCYLDPTKVKEASEKIKQNPSQEPLVDLYIYDKVTYEICPAPNIRHGTHDQYKRGYYVSFQIHSVPESFLKEHHNYTG